MAKGPIFNAIVAAFASASKLNANFAAIVTSFQNTLSLDGSTPNAMTADFDLGGNDILNGGDANFTDVTIDGLPLSAQAEAAAASATAAATSETNAAASFDEFDDRYLGDKASDTSLDNDSNALLTGALYFNTGTDLMRV